MKDNTLESLYARADRPGSPGERLACLQAIGLHFFELDRPRLLQQLGEQYFNQWKRAKSGLGPMSPLNPLAPRSPTVPASPTPPTQTTSATPRPWSPPKYKVARARKLRGVWAAVAPSAVEVGETVIIRDKEGGRERLVEVTVVLRSHDISGRTFQYLEK